jgi:hypothetical protein
MAEQSLPSQEQLQTELMPLLKTAIPMRLSLLSSIPAVLWVMQVAQTAM